MSAIIEEVTALLKTIAGNMATDGRLWKTADVAGFLNLNPDYVREHILTRGDFPKAVDLPGKGREPIRRYRAQDVRDWAEKWR